MKMIDDVIIIGIDSGYGNIKTANCCFPASVSAYDKEPVFKENLLVYESKFYLIGEGHKEFLADQGMTGEELHNFCKFLYSQIQSKDEEISRLTANIKELIIAGFSCLLINV